jgi:3-deoxy-D-manno-octulosonic-acid transferase
MYLLYSLLLTVGFLLLLPWFAIDAFRTRKYITGLGQRLGKLPAIAPDPRPLIWLHCVSVGETEAARPLVRELFDRFPSHRIAISTTTVTGHRVACNAFKSQAAAIFYFPLDWAWTVRRVLRTLKPEAILIMETELWPHLLRECKRSSIPVALINGRISITSLGRYRKIRFFMQRVLANITIAMMQSAEDASRLRELGYPKERILTPGNLKFDSAQSSVDLMVATELRRRFAFDESMSLIVAASTHAPEESIVIEAFKQMKRSPASRRPKLLIAPRHPERFGDVALLLEASGLTWSRRSADPKAEDPNSEVVLLDTIGELRAAYSLAELSFVGGSIAPHGGHNILEPAALAVCVITGPHTHNFAAVTRAMLKANAIVQLPEVALDKAAAELAGVFEKLLSDDTRRHEMGERAAAVCDQNRGATERTLSVIANLLEKPNTAGERLGSPALPVTAAK